MKSIFYQSDSYSIAMKEMFKQIHQNKENPLTTGEINQKLMTDIGGEWYLKNVRGGYHH